MNTMFEQISKHLCDLIPFDMSHFTVKVNNRCRHPTASSTRINGNVVSIPSDALSTPTALVGHIAAGAVLMWMVENGISTRIGYFGKDFQYSMKNWFGIFCETGAVFSVSSVDSKFDKTVDELRGRNVFDGLRSYIQVKRIPDKVKYYCPTGCGVALWGKPKQRVKCGTCDLPLKEFKTNHLKLGCSLTDKMPDYGSDDGGSIPLTLANIKLEP